MRSRRFIQVLFGLFVLGWLVAVVVALANYGTPTAADLDAAREQQARGVEQSNDYREDCLTGAAIPDGVSPDDYSGPPVTPDDVPVDIFLAEQPYSVADDAEAGAIGFAAAAAALAFLLGATWIGAQWSTRSIVALLFWEPRRSRVLAVEVGCRAGCTCPIRPTNRPAPTSVGTPSS